MSKVLIGKIVGAHGLKGEVKIATFTSDAIDVGSYGPISIGNHDTPFKIEQVRVSGPANVVAKLSGITDRNAAEALRGGEIYVNRDKLPHVEDDEYYHSDLIGLSTSVQNSDITGKVIAIHNFGASDLIEIKLDGETETRLIPFEKNIVTHIDLSMSQMILVSDIFDEDDAS